MNRILPRTTPPDDETGENVTQRSKWWPAGLVTIAVLAAIAIAAIAMMSLSAPTDAGSDVPADEEAASPPD